jgi:RND family efflux transporter MFP subunit
MRGVFKAAVLIICIVSLQFAAPAGAQEKSDGPPPAMVVTAPVQVGLVSPYSEFIGTVYYHEVSDVAAEVSGLVESVRYEEGERVRKGQILVKLNSDILEKRLEATLASFGQIQEELAEARINLARREKLRETKSISEMTFDENKFQVRRLEKRSESLLAEGDLIKLEIERAAIRSPFDGVALKRHVDRGEWIAAGDPVAVIAKDDVIDVIIDLPERYIPYVKNGMPASLEFSGRKIEGKVAAIVPRGDIATRTFPIKIRLPNTLGLIEGMTAKVSLPTGNEQQSLIVPRDAVIPKFGQTVVFAVVDAKAKMVPVKIVGYKGLKTGITAAGLSENMTVVVKGNERLRDGQPVIQADKGYDKG